MVGFLNKIFGKREHPETPVERQLAGYGYSSPPGKNEIMDPDDLLNTKLHYDLVQKIRKRFHSETLFDEKFYPLIRRMAENYNTLPASKKHHHSGEHGLLTHTLEVIGLAIQYSEINEYGFRGSRRSLVKGPMHIATGLIAMVHDAGKPITDVIVHKPGDSNTVWDPMRESLYKWGQRLNLTHYDYHFVRGRHQKHETHTAVQAGILIKEFDLVFPEEVRELLVDALTNSSNKMAQVVHRADRDSVARYLSGVISTTAETDYNAAGAIITIMQDFIQQGEWDYQKACSQIHYSKYGLHLVYPLALQEIADYFKKNSNQWPGIELPYQPQEVAEILADQSIIKTYTEGQTREYVEKFLPFGVNSAGGLNCITLIDPDQHDIPHPDPKIIKSYTSPDGKDLMLADGKAAKEPSEDQGPENTAPEDTETASPEPEDTQAPATTMDPPQLPVVNKCKIKEKRLEDCTETLGISIVKMILKMMIPGGAWYKGKNIPCMLKGESLVLAIAPAFEQMGVMEVMEENISALDKDGLLLVDEEGRPVQYSGDDAYIYLAQEITKALFRTVQGHMEAQDQDEKPAGDEAGNQANKPTTPKKPSKKVSKKTSKKSAVKKKPVVEKPQPKPAKKKPTRKKKPSVKKPEALNQQTLGFGMSDGGWPEEGVALLFCEYLVQYLEDRSIKIHNSPSEFASVFYVQDCLTMTKDVMVGFHLEMDKAGNTAEDHEQLTDYLSALDLLKDEESEGITLQPVISEEILSRAGRQ